MNESQGASDGKCGASDGVRCVVVSRACAGAGCPNATGRRKIWLKPTGGAVRLRCGKSGNLPTGRLYDETRGARRGRLPKAGT